MSFNHAMHGYFPFVGTRKEPQNSGDYLSPDSLGMLTLPKFYSS